MELRFQTGWRKISKSDKETVVLLQLKSFFWCLEFNFTWEYIQIISKDSQKRNQLLCFCLYHCQVLIFWLVREWISLIDRSKFCSFPWKALRFLCSKWVSFCFQCNFLITVSNNLQQLFHPDFDLNNLLTLLQDLFTTWLQVQPKLPKIGHVKGFRLCFCQKSGKFVQICKIFWWKVSRARLKRA